jgi:diphthamide biosynthesis methyltransferase
VEKKEVEVTTYTMAQVDEIKAGYEKQVAELKEQLVAKDKEVESLKAAKKEEVVVAEEKPILATGHKKMDAAKEDVDAGNALVNILKHKKANRKN